MSRKRTSKESPHQTDDDHSEKRSGFLHFKENLTSELWSSEHYQQNLSDREKLSWAYQTETRIRFSKLKGARGSKTRTLNSPYLIDIYPDRSPAVTKTVPFATLVERDLWAWGRKLIPQLSSKGVDGTLAPVTIHPDKIQAETNTHTQQRCQIPPNFLVFEILLEAYMGYSTRGLLNHPSPDLPRGAVMGGTIVAVLTSGHFVPPATLLQLESVLISPSTTSTQYQQFKEKLVKDLHELFIYKGSDDRSPFCLGDVDIFYQVSPLLHELLASTPLSILPEGMRGKGGKGQPA